MKKLIVIGALAMIALRLPWVSLGIVVGVVAFVALLTWIHLTS